MKEKYDCKFFASNPINVDFSFSTKPKTFKLERLMGDEFIFNDDLTRYRSIRQLMNAYSDPQNVIYLAECIPPSEYGLY